MSALRPGGRKQSAQYNHRCHHRRNQFCSYFGRSYQNCRMTKKYFVLLLSWGAVLFCRMVTTLTLGRRSGCLIVAYCGTNPGSPGYLLIVPVYYQNDIGPGSGGADHRTQLTRERLMCVLRLGFFSSRHLFGPLLR